MTAVACCIPVHVAFVILFVQLDTDAPLVGVPALMLPELLASNQPTKPLVMIGVNVAVGVGVLVGIGDSLGLGVGVGLSVGEGVGLADGLGVGLGVTDGLGVGDRVNGIVGAGKSFLSAKPVKYPLATSVHPVVPHNI